MIILVTLQMLIGGLACYSLAALIQAIIFVRYLKNSSYRYLLAILLVLLYIVGAWFLTIAFWPLSAFIKSIVLLLISCCFVFPIQDWIKRHFDFF